ncbi:unnamed protein product [Parnassius apollo]|uniref:(apollo) hypothetical protein n=1 Tax=Parnassius apollo TaxID=110799 RepID=A0A8S3VZS4_PARAO|nr:unnamed protein product [Parnassius apollo]
MGDSKKPEANLEAIYRLEFYKKQKNWKLSKDKKNKKSDQGEVIKNRVNETYDVLEPKTKVCELNDRFSKTGYGVPSTSNCQQSYTSKPVTPDYPAYNSQNAFLPQHVYGGIWNYSLQDHINSKLNVPQTESKYWSGGKYWSQGNFDSYRIKQEHLNFNICSEKPQGWLDINKNENHVLQSDQASPQDWPNYTNALKWYDDYTFEDTPVPPNMCTRLPEGAYRRGIQEMMCSNAEVEFDSISQVPPNSWDEFERGAHVAAHSTERELNVSNVLTENAVAQLSPSGSRKDIPTEAIIMWYLQLEEIRLQHLNSPFSLTPRTNTHAGTVCNSYEEYLTRNFNTSARQTAFNCETPHHEKPSTTNDLFVVGRGRGRLQVAPGVDNYKNIEGVKGRRSPFRL